MYITSILKRSLFLLYSDLILSDLLSILNFLLMNTSTNLKNNSEKNHNNNNYDYDSIGNYYYNNNNMTS